MSTHPLVTAATQVLAHAPGLARHGSKPRRELETHPDQLEDFLEALRSFDDAVAYPPHQAWIGNMHPRDLPERPWVEAKPEGEPSRFGPFGELMPEVELFGLMAAVDQFELLTLAPDVAERAQAALADHPLSKWLDLDRIEKAAGDPAKVVEKEEGVASLHIERDRLAGAIRPGEDFDSALAATILMENLSIKATGVLALLHLLQDNDIDPASIDFVIGCGEEAVGDRYQRGGGNMAKAVAEAVGLKEASGFDIKNFCAAPIPALVVAGSLVASGVMKRVAVVAGGSLAKLGMKFQGALKHDLPILEDVLGGAAVLVEAGDGGGEGARLRLDVVGRHTVADGGSNPQIMEALALEPLERSGLKTTDVDDFATELHNPEITEPQGTGNVPERNYKTIAALAARRGDIEKADIQTFMEERGMPGFAPTQGHLASALCYLPHGLSRIGTGKAERLMLLAKGSLFLGRMCTLSDGMSVLLDRDEEG